MPTIKIFQIYYEESQHAHLDEAFFPYDNSKPSRDGEFEIGVLQDSYLAKNHYTADYAIAGPAYILPPKAPMYFGAAKTQSRKP